MINKQRTNKQSQLGCFSGSQAGLVNQTMEKNEMDEEAQSITPIQSHDKLEPELNVNPDIQANQKSSLWKFRELCKFWQPILGTSAAIVSLLVALAQIF
ncbi:hypothetical protein [Nostoc sp. ChiQUE01b]|uniref:hypothetical protein n=1 Tax=Nostoc sp. ChiQUE01b TaxID=3075376 RepID=UPI002AD51262|nr:hypothetical protein [Nostoc sp. ChiQUE01b]MDZ8259875.1 hypothetical protein [Nostoc sp. ChiQUE01b]